MNNISDDQYKERALRKYGDLIGELHIVELVRNGTKGLGLSLAGNKNLTIMSVFVVNILPDSPAAHSGLIHIGDELLEINGLPLYGRSHLNASPIVKSVNGPKIQILLLRSNCFSDNLAVTPKQDCQSMKNIQNELSSSLIKKNNYLHSTSIDTTLETSTEMAKLKEGYPTLVLKIKNDYDLKEFSSKEKSQSLTNDINYQNNKSISNNIKPSTTLSDDDEVFTSNNYYPSKDLNILPTLTLDISRNRLPLGVHIIGGSDCLMKRFYVHEIYNSGAAYKDGNLHIGDEVIQINGELLNGKTQAEANEMLRSFSNSTSIVIARAELNFSDKYLLTTPPPLLPSFNSNSNSFIDNLQSSFETKKIVLTKRPTRPLGFVIATSHNDTRTFVKDVFKGSAAEADGLQTNDEIICINKRPIKCLSLAHTASLLKSSSGHINLEVLRIKIELISHRLSFRKSTASSNFELKKSRSFKNRAPLPDCLKTVD